MLHWIKYTLNIVCKCIAGLLRCVHMESICMHTSRSRVNHVIRAQGDCVQLEMGIRV